MDLYLIEVYADIVAQRTATSSVHDPKDFSDFVVPNWETDIMSIDGATFNFRLERLVRVEGPDPIGLAEQTVRQEVIAPPEGWSISSIEIRSHMSFGKVDRDDSEPSAPQF